MSGVSEAWDRALTGRWSRIVLALLAGIAAAVAHPPFGFLPGLLGYPLLMLLAERSARARGGFWMGWLAGFAYFFIGCWWVAEAFLVNAEAHAWMAPFAASLLPAGLALFWGLAGVLHRRLAPRTALRPLFFAAVFCGLEWLRGHVLTGFPWNLIGESLAASSDALMQAAALVGAYGLSFIALLITGAIATFDPRGASVAHRLDREIFAAPAIALAGLALIWIGGSARLSSAQMDLTGGTEIRIVHPNTPFVKNWDSEERLLTVIGQLLRMSAEPTAERPEGLRPGTLVVWPENAVPVLLAREPYVLGAIGRMLPEGGHLIVGSNRGEPEPDGPSNLLRIFYNSLYVVSDKGEIVETYDKHHLVPFGEYVPLRHLLGRLGLRQIVQFQGSFETGPGPRTLTRQGLPPVSPLICYEVIFADEVVARGERPAWFVNITNDAWFGASAGPYQHFSQVRLRAVEQGLPIARSANSGISALVDPYGRVLKSLPLDRQGVIDAVLPAPLAPTLYARLGDLFPALLMVVTFAAAWHGRRLPKSTG